MELTLLYKLHTFLIAFQFLNDHSNECYCGEARSALDQLHYVIITAVVLTWCLAPKHSHLDVSISRLTVFSH